jgi:hypothetical protein
MLASGADGVDDQQSVVRSGVHSLANRLHVAGNSGRGLVVYQQQSLVGARAGTIGAEALFHHSRRNTLAPAERHFVDFVAQVPGSLGE